MRALVLGLSLVSFVALADDPSAAETVYEAGKSAYDAKRYDDALQKFDEAARLEPSKARWQYNRGLALRKLQRDDEARAAFLESRRLDPTYKQREIDEKLADLDARGGSSGPSEWPTGLVVLLTFVFAMPVLRLALWWWKRSRKPRSEEQRQVAPGSNHQQVIPLLLRTAGTKLSRCEHALSLGDDEEARGLLDQAFTRFVQLRGFLRRDTLTERELDSVKGPMFDAAKAAEERLRARHGAAFDTAIGPRVGCFFCARPLPTAETRQAVQLKRGHEHVTVEACRLCARRAGTNTPPRALFVRGPEGEVPWSALPQLDPYELAYSDRVSNTREAGLGELSRPEFDLSHLATLAGLTGATAVAARALDLDALAEAEAASAAATAAARSASSRRNESRWNDAS